MISHKRKFIFVHIPKNAGRSICQHLRSVEPNPILIHGIEGKADHAKPKNIIESLGKSVWDEYFKFCFVRDPWSRLLSSYEYSWQMIRSGDLNNWYGKPNYGRKILLDLGYDFEKFVLWMKTGNMKNLSLAFKYQSNWLRRGENMVDYNFIGRFENLASDFALVCEHLDIDPNELPYINKSNTNSGKFEDRYTPEMREIVSRIYAPDISLLKSLNLGVLM